MTTINCLTEAGRTEALEHIDIAQRRGRLVAIVFPVHSNDFEGKHADDYAAQYFGRAVTKGIDINALLVSVCVNTDQVVARFEEVVDLVVVMW